MSDSPIRKPWLGDRWKDTGLLILGESHYWHADPEDPEITQIVMSDMVSGRRKHRFFTSVERAVTGCAPGQTDPSTFWPTVAFANFCPGAVEDRSVRATAEMMKRGIDAFPAMLADLRPRRILFVSKRCWDATERLKGVTWTRAGDIVHDEHTQETGFFGVAGFLPGAYAMNIQHPAAYGWSANWWHLFVADFLARDV